MKATRLILILVISSVCSCIFSQTTIITDDGTYTTGHASSVLDVKSTTKGVLIPRFTLAQRNAVSSPAAGLLIFQTDNTPGFYYYNGSSWTSVGGGSAADGSETIITAGTSITKSGSGTTATPYVISYATHSVTQAQRNALFPVAGQIVLCNNCGQYGELQVYDGSKWTNFIGGTASSVLAVGDNFQGGKIGYIFESGDPGYVAGQVHGLIALSRDLSTGAVWGCSGTLISGADGLTLGTGNQNTTDIEAGCSTAGTPADLCANLVENGYSDWYLPSRDEMVKICSPSNLISLTSTTYWSSSEYSSTQAYRVIATGGTWFNVNKTGSFYVRAVRTF